MFASIIALLTANSALPSGVVKALLALLAAGIVVIVATIGFHTAASYLANERAVAVTAAKNEATAEIAAKVNAETVAAQQQAAADQAAAMKRLDERKAADDNAWQGIDAMADAIADQAPAILDPLPAAEVAPGLKQAFAPAAAPARAPAHQVSTPKPKAAPHVPSQAFSDFVRADAAADRLLERATATAGR